MRKMTKYDEVYTLMCCGMTCKS